MAKYSIPFRTEFDVEIDEALIRGAVNRSVDDWLLKEGQQMADQARMLARAIYDSALRETIPKMIDAEVKRIVDSVVNEAEIRRMARSAVNAAVKGLNKTTME